MEVMKRIKELIKDHGYTQEDFAEKLGMTRVGLNKILNGQPSYTTLEKISDALNVEIWELFTSREEVIGDELTALVQYGDSHFKATSISDLERIVADIKEMEQKNS